jgi:hypothetical protein
MKAPQFISDLAACSRPMPDRYRQLAALEPVLASLWGDAVYYADYWASRPKMRLRGRQAAWRGIEGELGQLVGPGRQDRDDILGSSAAWDCAHGALKGAMGV